MIPSYDDLTPGIPDVVDSETVNQLELFLQKDLHKRPGDQEKSFLNTKTQIALDLPVSCLYACLRLQTVDRELRPTANGQLLTIARDFSPRVMRASDGEVLLDVSGLGRLIGEPPEIARQLAHAIFDAGVAASVALGPTQTMARVLAHAETGHGLTLRHKDHKTHEVHKEQKNSLWDLCELRGLCGGACGRGPWAQLPVHLLQELEVLPPAMNHRDRARPYETFERWGITTLGDLAALPAADLSSRLGRRGIALQRLARGLDPRPFVPDGETPRYIGRLELEWPLDTLEPLSFVFARLLDPLSVALERADRGATAIHLDLRLTDRSTHTRLLPLPAPIRDPRVLRTLLLLDLESSSPTAAVDIVSLELDPAPARITQFSLLQRALPSPETLSTLTARLSALVGETRIGSPVLEDSHRPGAFEMQRYAPEKGAEGAKGAPGANGASAKGAVGANDALMLRRQRHPPAIRVSIEHGRPAHIAASKRGIPSGLIIEAAGPWRWSGGWWTTGTDACLAGGKGRGWDRNEWDVALKSGAVCRIFQERTTNRWFLEGIYD